MYFIHRTTQPGHYRFFLIPPKNPYSNQATQKNTCQIFIPQKIPESKISNPKKSLDYPRHLKSQVPPPPHPRAVPMQGGHCRERASTVFYSCFPKLQVKLLEIFSEFGLVYEVQVIDSSDYSEGKGSIKSVVHDQPSLWL